VELEDKVLQQILPALRVVVDELAHVLGPSSDW